MVYNTKEHNRCLKKSIATIRKGSNHTSVLPVLENALNTLNDLSLSVKHVTDQLQKRDKRVCA